MEVGMGDGDGSIVGPCLAAWLIRSVHIKTYIRDQSAVINVKTQEKVFISTKNPQKWVDPGNLTFPV